MTLDSRGRARSVEEMAELGRKAAVPIREGKFIGRGALAAGVPESTFYHWLNATGEGPEAFQREVMAAYYDAAGTAEEQALRDIAGGDRGPSGPHASFSKWWLEKRYPKAFGASRIEITGADGGPIATRDLSTAKDTELLSLLESTKVTDAE